MGDCISVTCHAPQLKLNISRSWGDGHILADDSASDGYDAGHSYHGIGIGMLFGSVDKLQQTWTDWNQTPAVATPM